MWDGGITDACAKNDRCSSVWQVPVENRSNSDEQDVVSRIADHVAEQFGPHPSIQIITKIPADLLEKMDLHGLII